MFIYEAEHFLEVESKEIQKLCRSTVAVALGSTEPEAYAVHAVLCDYLHNSEQRCCVAFSDKVTKRSLLFAVVESESLSPWQYGQKILSQLGFQLEDVNLQLSPAMLDVVLRDTHGILAPAVADKQRAEKSHLLAGFQRTYDEDPDSAQGKRAAFKLSAEKRRNAQSRDFRRALEALFSASEKINVESATHASQMQELMSRLDSATALAEEEHRQRQMSEAITAAAEKRIQELEEILVDAETRSSKALKQKQKNARLQERIKTLEEKLEFAEVALAKEREERENAMVEAHAACERFALLERELKEAVSSLTDMQSHQANEVVEKDCLTRALRESELCIKTLGAELEDAARKALQRDVEARISEDVQAQLAEVQQALKEALALNSSLEELLAAANEQRDTLKESLCAAEKAVENTVLPGAQTAALIEQIDVLTVELEALRDHYEQECGHRKRLETQVAEGERRTRELVSLRTEVDEMNQRSRAEQLSREALETAIDEAHHLIDALENKVRETEDATREQLSHGVAGKGENHLVRQLEDQLQILTNHLEQQHFENKKLTAAVAAAEKKIAEQEELLVLRQAAPFEQQGRDAVVAGNAMQNQAKAAKRLPHELRPAPRKGAFFCPDWDLKGLPCKSSAQVFKAWESVFNVQISLEGYQSQYCMAFLVVLRLEKQKKLYMLYRLKLDKHTLICVPARAPKDEASLKAAIKEGLNYLKLSGFEMDEMAEENVERTLGPYFLAD